MAIVVDTDKLLTQSNILKQDASYYHNKKRVFYSGAFGSGSYYKLSNYLSKIGIIYGDINYNITNCADYIKNYITSCENIEKKYSRDNSIDDYKMPKESLFEIKKVGAGSVSLSGMYDYLLKSGLSAFEIVNSLSKQGEIENTLTQKLLNEAGFSSMDELDNLINESAKKLNELRDKEDDVRELKAVLAILNSLKNSNQIDKSTIDNYLSQYANGKYKSIITGLLNEIYIPEGYSDVYMPDPNARYGAVYVVDKLNELELDEGYALIDTIDELILRAEHEYNQYKGIKDSITGKLENAMFELSFVSLSDYDGNSKYKGIPDSTKQLLDDASNSKSGKIVLKDENSIAAYLSYMINEGVGNTIRGGVDGHSGYSQIVIDSNDGFIGRIKDYLSYMTDTEKGIFNYLFNTGDAAGACAFLGGLIRNLDSRWYEDNTQKDKEYATKNAGTGILASLESIPLGAYEGLRGTVNTFKYVNSDYGILSKDTYSHSDMYRSFVGAEISDKYGAGWAFTYNTVMSMADSVMLIAANAATGGSMTFIWSAALMGGRAYTSSFNDAKQRGLSDKEAMLFAGTSAIIETAMEGYSVGHLYNLDARLGSITTGAINKVAGIENKALAKTGVKLINFFGRALSQGIAEGEEEFCTEVLNNLADRLISGDLSNYSLTVNEYILNGMSEEEAIVQATKDHFHDVYEAFLGGFVSGFCFGAFDGGMSNLSTSAIVNSQTITNSNYAQSFVDILNERAAFAELQERLAKDQRKQNAQRIISDINDILTGKSNNSRIDISESDISNVSRTDSRSNSQANESDINQLRANIESRNNNTININYAQEQMDKASSVNEEIEISEVKKLEPELQYSSNNSDIFSHNVQDILKDKNLLDIFKRSHDNEELLKSYDQYVKEMYDYLTENNRIITDFDYKYNLALYLEIDGLRELLLGNKEVIDYISKRPDSSIINALVNSNTYDIINKDSKLFHDFIIELLQGKHDSKIIEQYDITTIINALRNGKIESDFDKSIFKKYFSNDVLSDFKEGKIGTNQQEVQKLVDFISLVDILGNPTNISAEEISKVYNHINSLLIQNANLLDDDHLQSHITNFSKYYWKSICPDAPEYYYTFKYEDSNEFGARVPGGSIWYNKKYFNEDFRSDNRWIDRLVNIFHEHTHAKQNYEVSVANESIKNGVPSSKINKSTLTNQIDEILDIRSSHKYYTINYENIFIEIDARFNAAYDFLNYLKEMDLPQELHDSLLKQYEELAEKERELFSFNRNIFDKNGKSIGRDAALDLLLKEDPSLLDGWPILKCIYNEDGTRKTIIELQTEIDKANVQETKDMFNYYIEKCDYSLSQFVKEMITLTIDGGKSLTTLDYNDMMKLLSSKFSETVLRNVNALTESNYKEIISEEISKYRNGTNDALLDSCQEKLLEECRQILDSVGNNLMEINDKRIIINYINENCKNPDVNIEKIIAESNLDFYKVIINAALRGDITDTRVITSLFGNSECSKYVFDNYLNRFFDSIYEKILSQASDELIVSSLTVEQINSLSEENRAKFESLRPGIIDKISSNNDLKLNLSSNLIFDVRKVSEIDMSRSLLSTEPNINKSYEGYDYIVRPKSSLIDTVNELSKNNDGSNILLEINSINELTLDLVENIPNNVKVRIANYSIEDFKSFREPISASYTLEHLTYTGEELYKIVEVLEDIKLETSKLSTQMEKARYVYNYLKDNLEYREPGENATREAHFDSLLGLVKKQTTCQGSAHIYSMILNSLGIKTYEIWGQFDGSNSHRGHAFNVVDIDGNLFAVDTVREAIYKLYDDEKYSGTGFGIENIEQYIARNHKDLWAQVKPFNNTKLIEETSASISQLDKNTISTKETSNESTDKKISSFFNSLDVNGYESPLVDNNMINELLKKDSLHITEEEASLISDYVLSKYSKENILKDPTLVFDDLLSEYVKKSGANSYFDYVSYGSLFNIAANRIIDNDIILDKKCFIALIDGAYLCDVELRYKLASYVDKHISNYNIDSNDVTYYSSYIPESVKNLLMSSILEKLSNGTINGIPNFIGISDSEKISVKTIVDCLKESMSSDSEFIKNYSVGEKSATNIVMAVLNLRNLLQDNDYRIIDGMIENIIIASQNVSESSLSDEQKVRKYLNNNELLEKNIDFINEYLSTKYSDDAIKNKPVLALSDEVDLWKEKAQFNNKLLQPNVKLFNDCLNKIFREKIDIGSESFQKVVDGCQNIHSSWYEYYIDEYFEKYNPDVKFYDRSYTPTLLKIKYMIENNVFMETDVLDDYVKKQGLIEKWKSNPKLILDDLFNLYYNGLNHRISLTALSYSECIDLYNASLDAMFNDYSLSFNELLTFLNRIDNVYDERVNSYIDEYFNRHPELKTDFYLKQVNDIIDSKKIEKKVVIPKEIKKSKDSIKQIIQQLKDGTLPGFPNEINIRGIKVEVSKLANLLEQYSLDNYDFRKNWATAEALYKLIKIFKNNGVKGIELINDKIEKIIQYVAIEESPNAPKLKTFMNNEMKKNFEKYFGNYIDINKINEIIENTFFLNKDDWNLVTYAGNLIAGFYNGHTIFIRPHMLITKKLLQTVSHEVLHYISANCIYVCGVQIGSKYSGLNESITDTLASISLDDKLFMCTGYGSGVTNLNRLIKLAIPGFTLENIQKAYFVTHDTSDLRLAIDNFMGEGYFENKLVPAFDKACEIGNALGFINLDKVVNEIAWKKRLEKFGGGSNG